MLAFEVDTTGLTRMEQALARLADKQLRFAAAQALNDCTRAASVAVNQAMPEVFDRPTAFTGRAAVAPRSLAATPASMVSTVTLRDRQAKYLQAEEAGGTRTPAMNTRKQGSALVLPGKGLVLDAFGNIPSGTLRNLKAQSKAEQRARRQRAAKSRREKQPRPEPVDQSGTVVFLAKDAVANKAHIGGYFRRLAGGHLTRLTAFEPETHYKARMGYHARVQGVFAATWAPSLARRFAAAIASAR